MTTYSEKNSLSLLTGAYDPDSDPISVHRINGVIISTWPHIVSLTTGSVSVTEDGEVTYDDGGSTAGHPADGASAANGSFTFTLWDGVSESPSYTCTIQLNGAGAGDTVAPTPTSMLPARTSTDQDNITQIALTYSEPIQFASSGNVDIWNDTTDTLIERFVIGTDEGSGAGTMDIANATLNVRPSAALPSLTQVSLRVDPNAIEDIAGNPHAMGTIGGWWRFTTANTVGGDTTPPVIISMSPADGSSGAAINANVSLNFNEAVAFGASGTITLRNVTDNATIETFNVATDQGTGAGQVSISGTVLTIRPTADFANAKEISVRLSAGAVEDIAGNVHAGVSNDIWNFTTAQAGGPVSSYQFGSDTPAGQAGIPCSSFTADAAGHFARTGGKIVVTSAGAGAKLNQGPYAVTIDGQAETIAVVSKGIHVSSEAEFNAAVNTAKASPNADWKIIGRPGTTITTDNKTFTNIRMNGTFSDPNANGYAIVPRAQYNWNGQATISGGSLTMTCDNPGDMVFTGRLRFNGCDKIIMDGPTLRYVTTQPGYDLGDGSGFQNQGPQKVYQISIDSLNQGAGDYIFRNMTMGGYAAGVESCFFPSVLICNGNGAGHCVVEDCLVDGFFIGFDMSRTRRGVRRRNWYRRRIVDLDRIYYTRANVTGSNTTPSYQESTMNTDTDPVGMYPGDGGVYAQGAHADWLQIARQWGSAPAHLFWGRNVTVHDTDGSDRTAEIQSVFSAGNPLGLPNVGSTSFSNWATQPQGLHSGKTGIKVTGEFYENVIVSTALNAFTVAGLETDMTRNMIIEGRNLRPHPPSAKNGLRMYISIGPQAPVTWADNIFPRIQGAGTNVFNNIDLSTSVNLDEKASAAQQNSHPANFPGPFTSSVDGHIFQLDTSSPAALRADLAAKLTPKPGSMSAGKGPYG